LTLLNQLSRIDLGRPQGLRYFVLAAGLMIAAPAQAQIYTWTDANGHMVVSNKRPGSMPPSASYAVPRTTGIRATRPVAPSRASAYDDLIGEHSRSNGVRADLVRAVMQVESGFNPFARSPKGAMGLMQLMPATARQYGVINPFNPAENVRAGVAYLRELLDRYQNNEELALAAYNAGPGAVDKHGQTVPPYRETRDYVTRINRMSGPVVNVSGTTLYKATDVTPDGREIPKYTDKKPR
jgi:soluble lytic murein transglycosylase-like protein